MNVFSSLARELFRTMEQVIRRDPVSLQENRVEPLRQQQPRVPPVVRLAQYRDAFEHLPGGRGAPFDGRAPQVAESPLRESSRASFDFAQPAPLSRAQAQMLGRYDSFTPARRPPVDLSGGVKAAVAPLAAESKPAPIASNGFLASLADL